MLAAAIVLGLAPAGCGTSGRGGRAGRPAGATVSATRCGRGGMRVRSLRGQVAVVVGGRDASFSKRFAVCWLPTGRVTALTRESYATRLRLGSVAAAGPYAVAALSEVGLAGDEPTFSEVFEVNARTGRRLHDFFPGGTKINGSEVHEVVIAGDGAFAFRGTGDTCQGRVGIVTVASGGRHTLDCDTGAEPPGQEISMLTLTGQTISWTHMGATHSAALP